MKKLLFIQKKLNNKGMTLIELMVAIAILSVAIVPLMYAFVSTARYNAKGRELQQTTVLAQTVIENCKAYDVGEIYDKMNDKSFIGSMADASTLWGETIVGDNYTYYIANAKLENQRYDVTLELTPYEFTNLYDGTSQSSYDMLFTQSMNSYLDGVFTNNTASDGTPSYTAENMDIVAYEEALKKIADEIKADAATKPAIIEEVNVPYSVIKAGATDLKVYRNITISTNKTGDVTKATVNYKYEFELTSGNYTYNYTPPEGGTPIELKWDCGTGRMVLYDISFEIYNNAGTNAPAHPTELQNIYFFYYPAYNGSLTDYPIIEEKIIITNGLSDPINVYLVKQKNTSYTDAELNTLESSGYAPAIVTSGDMTLYHNLGDNLGGSSLVTVPTISGSATVNNLLYEKIPEILMYTAVVKVYPQGSYDGSGIGAGIDPIIMLDSTDLDW